MSYDPAIVGYYGLQPHKGASETPTTSRMVGPLKDFNPTRVRLKHVVDKIADDEEDTSTPQGCV